MYNNWAMQQINATLQMQYLQYSVPTSMPHPLLSQLPQLPPSEFSDDESEEEDGEETRTLFCANLDERVTEEILYEIFLQAGPLESVRIPKDNIGKQRTFGFVVYVHKCSLPYAMLLYNGLMLFRKTLTIKFQEGSNLSPQQRRRTVPADFEIHNSRHSAGGYDNAIQRGAYQNDNSQAGNPFKHSLSERTTGGSGSKNRENITKHPSTQSRRYQSMSPYQRPDVSRRSGGDSHISHSNDYQRRHHGGSNRRSEQRNNSRR